MQEEGLEDVVDLVGLEAEFGGGAALDAAGVFEVTDARREEDDDFDGDVGLPPLLGGGGGRFVTGELGGGGKGEGGGEDGGGGGEEVAHGGLAAVRGGKFGEGDEIGGEKSVLGEVEIVSIGLG